MKHSKMLFQFIKKGDLDDDENAGVKETDAKLKEKERAIKEKWDKLPLTSTCKDALEELYKVQWEAERKMMEKDLAERTKDMIVEKSEGLFSTIIGKIKGFFTPNKVTVYESFSENLSAVEKKSWILSQETETFTDTKQKKEKNNLTASKDKITDVRDGKVYKIAEFDGVLWMTENLNFAIDDSYCYDNDEKNCEKYGRLYTWAQAMHACPKGWRLPNNDDFKNIKQILEEEFGEGRAGFGLKSKKYNFVPVFAGDVFGKNFQLIDESNYLWSADDDGENHAYDWVISVKSDDFFMGNIKFALKTNGMSVRCVKK